VQHCEDDVLALAALGEPPTAADAAHLADCTACRDEVDSLRAVVTTVRVPVTDGAPVPPPQRVWAEIAAATGVQVTPRTVGAAPAAVDGPAHPVRQPVAADRPVPDRPVPDRPVPDRPVPDRPVPDLAAGDLADRPVRGRRRRPTSDSRRTLLAVAACAALVGAAGGLAGGSLLRSNPPAPTTRVVTQVVLAALPVDPGAKGEASVVSTGSGRQLAVNVSRLSSTGGFYEVWLIDRGVKKMIPLGILRGDRGEFAIPEGVDLGQYPIVDVSAEPLDGNPQHSGKSLLRGTISG
jgi:Anti-sigma-K factor rskA